MARGLLWQRVGPWLARLLSILTLLIVLSSAGPILASGPASPLRQEAAAVITSPQSGQSVRGTVQIIGSALHPSFQRYELYYTVEPGENWIFIGEAKTTPVGGGLLGTWETGGLPDGNYSLRLRVVRQDGNYDEGYARNIIVANTTPPTPTPTPTLPVDATLPPPIDSVVTPTPAATPTPAVVEQPEIPTPTPRPSPTATPEQQEQVAAGDSASSGDAGSGGSLTDVLETSALQSSFVRGAAIAASIFLAVGAFFGVRRLLMWLWYLIAP